MKRIVYLFTLLQLLNGTLSLNSNLRFSKDYDDRTETINRDRTIFDLNNPSSDLVSLPKASNLENAVSDFKCTPSVCLNEGICTSTGLSFQCKCPWGWTGSRCEICLTECASNPCSSNKRCKAKFGGGYECVCPADRVGLDCEIQNDLCATNPCLNDGVCKPIEGGSFSCICNKPWSGENCEKIWENPCTEDTLRSTEMLQFKDPWDRNSYLICTDISIYHNMPCSVGTYFNEKLRHCVPEGYDPPSCPDQHCKNDADCIIDEGNNLRCVCKKGYKGELCEENIDECVTQGGHEACDGGKCVDQINGFYCSCSNGVGLDCKQTIANPCTSDNLANDMQFFELKSMKHNVFLQCIGDSSFVVSKCADNLFWNPEQRTCTIDKPIQKAGRCLSFPCKNGGDCQESSDSDFKCFCKNGYTGQVCEEMIDFCISNPCINGGRCLSFAGGYTCVCPDKIVDECCCHGLLNPCPSKSKLIPGVNNYFPHLFPNRYLHCDFDGRAFARSCAPGLKWKQEALSCLPDNFGVETTNSWTNKTNKLMKIKENAVERKTVVVPKMMQPLTSNQDQEPIRPVQRESNNYQAYNQQKNDLQKGVMRSFEPDQVEDQEKQMQQIQQQQQFVQQQQQLQQQQLETQNQRDKLQQEQDQKQREQEKIRQQQELEEQRRIVQQQKEKVLEQQQKILQQQQAQQEEDKKREEELQKHLGQLTLPQASLDDEEQLMTRTKQDRDQRQRQQDEHQQQMQLQFQQQQQEQQRLQIEQQNQQIKKQFEFQRQQTLQEQQEQQRQQNIQTQFQQQLKQVPVFRSTGGRILEEDQSSSKLKVERDQRQRLQDERQQQMQLQFQQQQQEQQRLQIEQQNQQIKKQFEFQRQQTLQEQQEQQRQQNIQTQFQQQLKQLPIPMSSQQLEFDQRIPLNSLNKGFTAGSVLTPKETPKVSFSKSSNLYFKPTFSSNRKQPILNRSQ